jgi:hypothetical protein
MEYRYGTQNYLMEPGDTLQSEGDIRPGPAGPAADPVPAGDRVQWCRRLTGPRRPAAA